MTYSILDETLNIVLRNYIKGSGVLWRLWDFISI